MRHRKQGRKLGRERDQRRALLKSLSRSLVLHGRIKTTEARAKELRPFIEKLVSKSRSDTVTNRRHVAQYLDQSSLKELFTVIGPRYKERAGGYTRISKLGERRGDAAKEAIIEFVK